MDGIAEQDREIALAIGSFEEEEAAMKGERDKVAEQEEELKQLQVRKQSVSLSVRTPHHSGRIHAWVHMNTLYHTLPAAMSAATEFLTTAVLLLVVFVAMGHHQCKLQSTRTDHRGCKLKWVSVPPWVQTKVGISTIMGAN